MSSELREQFFTTIIHFRKLESALSAECEMQMNEMVILHSIAGTCCQECPCMNLDVPKMQKKLHISKPAISYILNTLEKKNYITREIDPKDRRKVSISATPEGRAAADRSAHRSGRSVFRSLLRPEIIWLFRYSRGRCQGAVLSRSPVAERRHLDRVLCGITCPLRYAPSESVVAGTISFVIADVCKQINSSL